MFSFICFRRLSSSDTSSSVTDPRFTFFAHAHSLLCSELNPENVPSGMNFTRPLDAFVNHFDVFRNKKRYTKREITHRPMTFFRGSEDGSPLQDDEYVTKVSPRAQVILSPRHISPGRRSNKSVSNIFHTSPVPVIFTSRSSKDQSLERTLHGDGSAAHVSLRNPAEESLEESAEADALLIQRTQSMIEEADTSGGVGNDISSRHNMSTRSSNARSRKNESVSISVRKNSFATNKSLSSSSVHGKTQNSEKNKDSGNDSVRKNDDSFHDSVTKLSGSRRSSTAEISCSDADSTKNNPAYSPSASEKESDMEEAPVEENLNYKPVVPVNLRKISGVGKKRSHSVLTKTNRETRNLDKQETMLLMDIPKSSKPKTSAKQHNTQKSLEDSAESERSKPKRRKRNTSPVKSLQYYSGKDHCRTKRNIVDLDFVMDCVVSTISEARENCGSAQVSSLLKNFKLQAVEGIAQTIENLEIIRTLKLDVAESRKNITAMKKILLDLQQKKDLLKSESSEEGPRLTKLQSINDWINSVQSLM